MLHEIFQTINESDDVNKALEESFNIPFVKNYVELAVSDKYVEFDPNDIITKKYNYHISMCGALLINKQTWNVVNNVIMSKDAKLETKIIQFKALSEMLYEKEAIILKHILLKNIEEIYPNITFQRMFDSTCTPKIAS